jgi:hypothetical protein
MAIATGFFTSFGFSSTRRGVQTVLLLSGLGGERACSAPRRSVLERHGLGKSEP